MGQYQLVQHIHNWSPRKRNENTKKYLIFAEKGIKLLDDVNPHIQRAQKTPIRKNKAHTHTHTPLTHTQTNVNLEVHSLQK